MKVRCTLCACWLAAVVLPHSVAAQNYTFTNIADSTGPFSTFFNGGPRLNNSGAVSFVAQLDAGGSGVYRSDGGVLTTIADNSSPLQDFRYSDINDAGQVAFTAEAVLLGQGIFRGDGQSTSTIIWASQLPFTPDTYTPAPLSINNAGNVQFYASGHQGNVSVDAVFVGSGGNITLISDPQVSRASIAQINNLGTVAFKYALFLSAGSGIALGTGGTTSTVINQTGPYSDFRVPSLNDSNVVAVGAKRDAGDWDVLRINGATVDVVAGPFPEDPGSGAAGVQDVGINNAGDMAFLAQVAPSTFGILTGPDPVADKVIRDGDTLFGSTVTDLFFNTFVEFDGPNDAGQIVFRYSLADGRQGIALATPVAPPTAGDYNHDDVVDAADYIVWRKDVILENAVSPGSGGAPDPGDYIVWRTHFGETVENDASASSLSANENVPEPSCFVLLAIAAAIVGSQRSFSRMG
jgi:hypothetical protein